MPDNLGYELDEDPFPPPTIAKWIGGGTVNEEKLKEELRAELDRIEAVEASAQEWWRNASGSPPPDPSS